MNRQANSPLTPDAAQEARIALNWRLRCLWLALAAFCLLVSDFFPSVRPPEPQAPFWPAGTVAPQAGQSGVCLWPPDYALFYGEALDINRASARDLELLPGIGPVLAARIVTTREQQGPFVSPEALLAVPGFGPARLARLKEQVCVREPQENKPF